MKVTHRVSPKTAAASAESNQSVIISQVGEKFNWRTVDFLKALFIYFWATSLLGHYLEVIWAIMIHLTVGGALWSPRAPTILPLAPPYGLGAIGVILLAVPLIKKYKLHPFGIFVLNVFITGAIEYLCAVVIVLIAGHNHFWNYSHEPFNINGYVCLKSAVIFSLAATFFIYFIYPTFDKLLHKLKKMQFDVLFWLLFISYAVDLVYLYFTDNLLH